MLRSMTSLVLLTLVTACPGDGPTDTGTLDTVVTDTSESVDAAVDADAAHDTAGGADATEDTLADTDTAEILDDAVADTSPVPDTAVDPDTATGVDTTTDLDTTALDTADTSSPTTGAADLLVWTTSGGTTSLRVRRSTGSAFAAAESWTGDDPSYFGGSELQGAGDFDGDGRHDLVTWNNSGGTTSLRVRRSTGSAFAAAESWTGDDPSFFGGSELQGVGDFDGDGRDDLVTWNNSGGTTSLRVRRSTGSAFDAAESWTGDDPSFFGGSQLQGVGDFDGDGRDDLVTWNNSGGTTSLRVRRSTGSAFAAAESWTGDDPSFFGGSELQGVGDFDGDGRDDLVTWNNSGGTTSLRVRRSTGSAFAAAESWTGDDPSFFGGSALQGVGDFDGDGRDDLVTWNNSGGTTSLRVRRSTGSAFAAAESWTGDDPSFFGGSVAHLVGDFDGE